jgi:hypothetical protein
MPPGKKGNPRIKKKTRITSTCNEKVRNSYRNVLFSPVSPGKYSKNNIFA